MPGEIFLEVNGIDGESKVAGYEGKIDVDSWSWGEINPATPTSGGGGGASTVTVNPLQIGKGLDKSSPVFMKYCAQLKMIDEMKLKVLKAGGDSALVYLTITLKNAYVQSYNTGGFDGGGGLKEDISFAYEDVNVEYDEQASGGSGTGIVSFGFNAMQYEIY